MRVNREHGCESADGCRRCASGPLPAVFATFCAVFSRACQHHTTPLARNVLVGGLQPLSSTLDHLRSKAHIDYRTHTYHVEDGYFLHALSYQNRTLYANHPSARGNVEGSVDQEAKVSTPFIPGAKMMSSGPRGRRAVPLMSMAAISTLPRSSSGTKSTLRKLLHHDRGCN